MRPFPLIAQTVPPRSSLTLGLQAVRLIGVVGSLPVLVVAVFVHNQPLLFLVLLLLLDMAWRDYR